MRVFSHMLHWSDNTAATRKEGGEGGGEGEGGQSSETSVLSYYDRSCPPWKLHPLLHAQVSNMYRHTHICIVESS